MIEIAEAGQGGRHVAVLPCPQQGHFAADAGRAEHRHQQRRLILAIAITAGERFSRRPRHDRPLAELHTRVANLAPQGRQQPLDDLVAIGFSADCLQRQRANHIHIEVRFHQLRVGRGHVVPGFARRKDDLRRSGVAIGQIVLARIGSRQWPELEDQRRAAVGFRADRLGVAAEDLVLQRQGGGGVDCQTELADGVRLTEEESLYDAVIEERTDLAGFDLLFNDRAHGDRRQRTSEQLVVAEEIRRVLFGRDFPHSLLIEEMSLSVGRNHANAEDGLLLAPRRPIGLSARPVVDALVGEIAVDSPRGAMLAALFVEDVGVLLEEHFHVGVLGCGDCGRRAEDLVRLGREGRQVPGRFHRGRAERTR